MSVNKTVILAPGVTQNPMVHSGAAVVQGRRIATATIAGWFAAGCDPMKISSDYEIPPEDVLNAVRYELRIKICRKYGGLKPTRTKKLTPPAPTEEKR